MSNEVALNFTDELQLVASSSFATVDTFLDVDEDVVLDICEDFRYESLRYFSDILFRCFYE